MTELADLQKSITETRARRGFVTDPDKILVLISEEIGEVASEIKRRWSQNYGEFDRNRLKDEIADVFVLLSAMADQFDIDIEQAVAEKFFQRDELRTWKSAVNLAADPGSPGTGEQGLGETT